MVVLISMAGFGSFHFLPFHRRSSSYPRLYPSQFIPSIQLTGGSNLLGGLSKLAPVLVQGHARHLESVYRGTGGHQGGNGDKKASHLKDYGSVTVTICRNGETRENVRNTCIITHRTPMLQLGCCKSVGTFLFLATWCPVVSVKTILRSARSGPIEDLDDFSTEKTKATTGYPVDYADAA